MDFASLLAQHCGGVPEEHPPSTFSRLDRPLYASREEADKLKNYFHIRCGNCGDYDHVSTDCTAEQKPHGRSSEPNFIPAEVKETEPGTFEYVSIWGEYPLWNETEWSCEEPGNMLVQFEAKGQDNIVVGLSPEPRKSSPMYEIVFGGWNNTRTVVRRESKGLEKALCTQKNICDSSNFMSYWIKCTPSGSITLGIGETPGKGVVLIWRDPEPVNPSYVSFTGWKHVSSYRNVRISMISKSEMDVDEAAIERYTSNNVNNNRTSRIVIGFDPTSEDEKKKAEERTRRFACEDENKIDQKKDEDDDMYSREKREARAKRFDTALIEDLVIGEGLLRDLTGLRVPRKDSLADDLIRLEALHIYGDFDGVCTADILKWFSEYGVNRIEWLHDCAANVLFDEEISCKRALAGLSRKLPVLKGFETQIEDLTSKGYFTAPYELQNMGSNKVYRFFLLRNAFVSDVKPSNREYRTTIGYERPKLRTRRFVQGERRRPPISAKVSLIRKHQQSSENDDVAIENSTGNVRKRDDSSVSTFLDPVGDDAEMRTVRRRRRMNTDDHGDDSE